MSWEKRFLDVLHASRPAFDEAPDWRAALTLYQGLPPAEAAELDRTVVAMIDEDYRNPFSTEADEPFGDVMTGLPAGLKPDDLLCIEAAALVSAERALGEAFFRLNALLRAPRWHALYPRLLWLPQVGFDAQRKLAATRAGRYLGAVLGLAAGDALGVTLEFQSRSQIRGRYPEGFREIEGGGPFGFQQGEWSDDTAMALAVARGILESPDDPVDRVGRHFMAWYDSCPPDVGSTCRMALEAFRSKGSWEAASRAVEQQLGVRAGGNGALMRTLPAALAYGRNVEQAVRIARMTHPHPESDAAIAVYQLTVNALLHGVGKAEALYEGLSKAGVLSGRLGALHQLTEPQVKSSGYVVDTLEAALWCFMTTESFEECIVRAVNLGDDTDTVGAVAGGLAGAYYGALALPRRWSAVMRGRDQLETVAAQLFGLAARR
jgi:ADP-ribosyl-[dinitrogen reductase] hydrolase